MAARVSSSVLLFLIILFSLSFVLCEDGFELAAPHNASAIMLYHKNIVKLPKKLFSTFICDEIRGII